MRPIRPWTILVIVLMMWLATGDDPIRWAIWWSPGPRVVVVVMESAQVTPQQARLYTAMRASALAGEWRIKGHQVYIIDKDQRTPSETQVQWLSRWSQWQQYALPVLMLGTPAGRLLYAGPLPASIEEVDALLKRHGG